MTSPLSIEQEADALEALVEEEPLGQMDHDEVIDVLRNRAMPLIRALRERVASLEYDVAFAKDESKTWAEKYYDPERNPYWSQQQTRIESLEAERELEYERAQGLMDHQIVAMPPAKPLPRFTPSDIAARVSERKARTP